MKYIVIVHVYRKFRVSVRKNDKHRHRYRLSFLFKTVIVSKLLEFRSVSNTTIIIAARRKQTRRATRRAKGMHVCDVCKTNNNLKYRVVLVVRGRSLSLPTRYISWRRPQEARRPTSHFHLLSLPTQPQVQKRAAAHQRLPVTI